LYVVIFVFDVAVVVGFGELNWCKD